MLSETKPTWKNVALFATGFFVVLFVFALGAPDVLAQSEGLEAVGDTSGLTTSSLPQVIGTIISAFLATLGVIFLIIIIYAGFLWMTAGGNPDQVDKAKKWMINATIGLVIMLASYAITQFIVNAITGAMDGGGGGTSTSGADVSIERLSGSLGAGGISYHYPDRNDTDIARNANIMITFKGEMDVDSFIEGYSDDAASTDLNTDNILIYATDDGESAALDADEVVVSVTEDLKTFVFNPVDYLGSSTEDTSYTVFVDDNVEDSDGDQVINSGGYEWSFEVSTEIDLDPPTVTSVTPRADGEYDRNITVQITFSEAIDPTTATGTREATSGFSNIQTYGTDEVPIAGTYEISNSYKTITFTSSDACGTNSCGETIYCLPGDDTVNVDVIAATVGDDAPQADAPYDGIVDASGNSLDGDDDGEAGDDYNWSFSTTDDINLDAPEISTIAPNILEEEVDLDTDVVITFDSVMMSNTLTSSYMSLDPNPTHEMWYRVNKVDLDSEGAEVTSDAQTAVSTQATISHGVFLASTEGEVTTDACVDDDDCSSGYSCNSDSLCEQDDTTYLYIAEVTSAVKNEYQNCYLPAEGPDEAGDACGTSSSQPYCCNGVPSATDCGY